jgi:hypothetical protein
MRTNRSLLTGLIIMTGATYNIQAQAQALPLPLVFAQTYVSAGAEAEFDGDIVATTYFVAGASTTVTGSIQTGTAITLGASSIVAGETESGTATTLGASTEVFGLSHHGTAFTLGAGALADPHPQTLGALDYEMLYVTNERNTLKDLDKGEGIKNYLESRMDVDKILNPESGTDLDGVDVSSGVGQLATSVLGTNEVVVYNLASLTTGAGITLTLTCGVDYVFNIADMLSLGAGTVIKMSTSGCLNNVTWNLGGYASVGEGAVMTGDVLANGYISTGVDSEMNGKLHSETSYVTIGASGKANQ